MNFDDGFFARLPAAPGVYIMKDAEDKILYVGKAISLRQRVRSYFRDGGDGRFFVPFLRGRIASIETVVTDTEKEALLLENTLIKKHRPRFNIQLRDDKTYVSLRLDIAHPWPRLHRTRKRRRGDKALYFGPFSSSRAVNETMRFLQRLFPLRSCTDHELKNRARPCILHQIDRCSAPCVGLVTPEVYARHVERTQLFLSGREADVTRVLAEKMAEYSEALQFEKAAMVRDRLRALARTLEEEKVHSHRVFDRDVVGMARRGGRIVFSVMPFRRGRLEEARTFPAKDVDVDNPELLEGFLSQYFDTTREVPRDVLLPFEPANREFLEQTLAQQRGGAVRLHVPERGAKRRLLEMANQNADANLERSLGAARDVRETLENLRSALKLTALPRHIECLDISNLQGSFPVGSLVSFRDGEPDKSGYRRFRIKTVEGQNDFACMQEVLSRHFNRRTEGDAEFPDLLIIDGGIGQLNAAVEVLRALGVFEKVPVVGLAKARVRSAPKSPGARGEPLRSEERIFLPGRRNPVTFRRNDPALHLVERVRDESHRFGVTYHRLLRSKSALKSGLEEVPGVGPKRRAILLKHFGSLSKIRDATLEEIQAVKGIPPDAARRIVEFLSAPRGESAGQEPGEEAWEQAEVDEEEE